MDDETLIGWEDDALPPPIQAIADRMAPNWPPEIDVGRGWWPLLVRLDTRLVLLNPNYALRQVKEKFGGLRVYAYEAQTGEIGALFYLAIWEAEREASRTCDICGRPGRLRMSPQGKYQTLCDDDSAGWKIILTGGENDETEARDLHSRVKAALDPRSGLAEPLVTFALDHPAEVSLASVTRLREEWGLAGDPSAEALLQILRRQH